jgi:hypothetical protein
MLQKFGKLAKALKFAYPEEIWDDKKFNWKGKKSTQKYMVF